MVSKRSFIAPLLSNIFHMKTISTKELQSTVEKGLPKDSLIVDVRTPAEYRSEHIASAENIPLDQIDKHLEQLKGYKTIYVHCRSGARSTQACEKLHQHQLDNMVNVEGGIAAWSSAGFQTIKGKKSYSIMQQVQITAGGLAFAGALLAHFYDPRFIWLSGFVGAGLLFAGLTGTCAMASCLSKMPWNK